MTAKKILIVSGEPSGDLHAANLVKNLVGKRPDLTFFGIGGSLSREAGVDIVWDISDLALCGFIEVIKNIALIRKVFTSILARVDSEKPDLAILVDYPGFNIRLAKELKKRSIPVIYYISPQVWAWGADRIGLIKKAVEKIIVFFKFEEELYRRNGVNAEFVGHPLLETVKPTLSKDEARRRYGLDDKKTVVALLPGSRRNEIKKLLPVMAGACALIRERFPQARFIVAKFKDLPLELYTSIIESSGIDIKIADGDTYNVLNAADFALVTSGTATLETAIMERPFIITYKANFLTAMLFYMVIRIHSIGLVNVIAGRRIVPEFLQKDATPEKMAAKAIEYLIDEKKRQELVAELVLIKNLLGEPGATDRAAKAILPYLTQ